MTLLEQLTNTMKYTLHKATYDPNAEEFAKKQAEAMGLEFSDNPDDINNPKKFMFIHVILHQHEPAEFQGLAFPNKERTQTVFLPVKFLPTSGAGILFFDEMNLANESMLKNAYQLIEDRRIGSYVVPKNYISIGAGNRGEDMCNVFDMPKALNNRFFHVELQTPAVDDVEISEPDINGEEHVVRTIKGWLNGYAIPNGIDIRIQLWLKFNKHYLFKFDPDSEDPAFATPRIWEDISNLLKLIPSSDLFTIREVVGAGAGVGMGIEFAAWLKLSEKFDIDKIYKEKKVKVPTNEIDQVYSLVSALLGYYQEHASAKTAIALYEISKSFSLEHTVMLVHQMKIMDNFKFLKEAEPEIFKRIMKEIPTLYEAVFVSVSN